MTVLKEVLEEVGLIVKNPKLFKISKAGGYVEWDLYYYEITDYRMSENGPELEEDELIDGFVWKNYDEIIKLCLNESIREERTIAVLLSYVLKELEQK